MQNSVSGLQLSALCWAICSTSQHTQSIRHTHTHLPCFSTHSHSSSYSSQTLLQETLFPRTNEILYIIKCMWNKIHRERRITSDRQLLNHQDNFLCQKTNQQKVCPANNLSSPTIDSVHGKHRGIRSPNPYTSLYLDSPRSLHRALHSHSLFLQCLLPLSSRGRWHGMA